MVVSDRLSSQRKRRGRKEEAFRHRSWNPTCWKFVKLSFCFSLKKVSGAVLLEMQEDSCVLDRCIYTPTERGCVYTRESSMAAMNQLAIWHCFLRVALYRRNKLGDKWCESRRPARQHVHYFPRNMSSCLICTRVARTGLLALEAGIHHWLSLEVTSKYKWLFGLTIGAVVKKLMNRLYILGLS